MVAANTRIGIVGAGTSGIFLANLLIQKGFQVTVFEKAAEPRTEGCGILLVQKGMNVLNEGDSAVCQKILEAGVPVTHFLFRNLKGGLINESLVTYEADELPGMLVHRKDILEALLEGLPPDCIRGNADFESVTQTEEGVTVQFKDGSSWTGDLLVGADGIGSKLRSHLVPNVELCYLGDLVWRGVTDDTTFCQDGQFIVYVRGRGIYANFFDLGAGRTHWGFFVEREQAEDEIGKLRSQDDTIPPKELAKLPQDARSIIEKTPLESIVTRFSYDIEPLPKICDGRIVLIGDAGHAKSSTRALGMTSGFEDGVRLIHYLVEYETVSEALRAYETERLPIVHEYQRSSRERSQTIGRRQRKAA
jgi:2-polyprenyl-6-methoxyphenol hydroxylase-like FAD-dependent oxidoreductase